MAIENVCPVENTTLRKWAFFRTYTKIYKMESFFTSLTLDENFRKITFLIVEISSRQAGIDFGTPQGQVFLSATNFLLG